MCRLPKMPFQISKKRWKSGHGSFEDDNVLRICGPIWQLLQLALCALVHSHTKGAPLIQTSSPLATFMASRHFLKDLHNIYFCSNCCFTWQMIIFSSSWLLHHSWQASSFYLKLSQRNFPEYTNPLQQCYLLKRTQWNFNSSPLQREL